MAFEDRRVEMAPVDRESTLTLGRAARRFLIKRGAEIVELDRARQRVSDADLLSLLLHDDGLLRIPVLVVGDLLVRGFTDELYQRALRPAAPAR